MALSAGSLAITMSAVSLTSANAAVSDFVELDGNVVHDLSTTPPFDWANSGTLTSSTTVGGTWTRAGSGGIFDGGKFQGNTTPPTAPIRVDGSSSIPDAEFKVDPLSVDKTSCGTGDPTVYTGAGSEVNGGLISSDTFGTGSVPNKDDLSNVYAVAHRDATTYEVFFGGERVINNGDSHIDYEFLQAPVTIPDACKGTFSGHRSKGDFLLSVDFTTGGTIGGTTIYTWDCGNVTPDADGICDPTKTKGGPSYKVAGSENVKVVVNDKGSIGCGGWVCRNPDGTPTTTLLTNELMEGGIDLKGLGFTGCVSTFLPHTRSSQSFTSVLKDFEIIPFNTCTKPKVGTTIVPSGPQVVGSTAHDTAQITGATATAGGTISYKLYSDSTCTTLVADLTPTTNTVVNGAAPASKDYTFNTVGTYYFYAEYSGDQINIGPVNSGCASEPIVITPRTPKVGTIIVADDGAVGTVKDGLAIGDSAHDTAQISDATADAGGTITYKLYSDATCTTLVADLTPTTNTVTNGSAPASKSYTFGSAGTFYFYAVYSGDTNNTGPVNSGCAAEPIVVKQNTPSVSTLIVADDGDKGNLVDGLAIGDSAHDTASLSGATSNAGGTISYKLYSDNSCTTLVADLTPTTNTVVNGAVPNSKSYTFTNAGTYYFYAVYSGDSNNKGPVNSGCAAEPLVVVPNTLTPTSTPVVQVKDTFSVSGFSSNATGKVTVGLFSDSTCTTSLGSADFAVSAAVNGTLSGATSFTTVASGSYYYQLTYAGDANNKSFTTACTDESAVVTITSKS